MKKWIKKSLLFFAISGIIFLFAGIIATTLYKDDIIRYLVKDLNKYVTTEISIQTVDFSLIRRFPNATVRFSDVVAKSTPNMRDQAQTEVPDTLFHIGNMYFSMNVLDILRKNYEIKRVELQNGTIHTLVDNRGEKNYVFWKNPETPSKSPITLNLKGLKMNNVTIIYRNTLKSFVFSGLFVDTYLKGKFSSRIQNLDLDASFFLNTFQIKNQEYANQLTEYSLDAGIRIEGDSIGFQRGNLTIGKLPFSLQGMLFIGDKPTVDLSIESGRLNLVESLEQLPVPGKSKLTQMRSKGNLSFQAKIRGGISHKKLPAIDVSFLLKNGSLSKKGENLTVENISFTGVFSNGNKQSFESSSLSLSEIKASINNRELRGSIDIENFQHPYWTVALKGQTALQGLEKFVSAHSLTNLDGRLALNLIISGHTRNINQIKPEEWARFVYRGDVELYDASFANVDKFGSIEHLSGSIKLDKTITVDHVSFIRDESDFTFNGQIKNLPGFLFLENELIDISATVTSNNIDLTRVIKSVSENKMKSDTKKERTINFPENVRFEGTFSIHDFTMNRFHAKNARGKVNYAQKRLILNSVFFESVEGMISGGGVIAQKYDQEFAVKGQSSLNDINIQQLFYSFNNFGQNVITDKNINGRFNGNITFSSDWTKDLSVVKQSIECQSDFKLNEGELIDFTPLLGLSKFIKMEELRHIRFSTLQNRIFIKDEIITIPQMNIESSALDINVYGLHRFDNSYDYHVKLLMADILGRKAKQNTQTLSEFGPIEDDGLGKTYLPLRIIGRGDDFKVTYDFKSVRRTVREQLKEEKNTLQKILKDEFGTKSNVESEIDSLKTKPSKALPIEWEEAKSDAGKNEPIKPAKERKDTTRNKNDFKIIWDEK